MPDLRARVTVLVRSTAGLEAKLKARTRVQRAQIKAATASGAVRVFETAQSLCPRDTHYMAEHMRVELTREGYNFAVGWRAQDFVGRSNPANGRLITEFYPKFVVFGTRRMAGRDPITPALRAEKPILRQAYVRALKGR